MAVVSSSPILSPLRTNRGSSYPYLPFLSTSSRPSNRPRPPIIVCSYSKLVFPVCVKFFQISVFSCLIEPFAFCGMVSEPGNGLASEEKKLLLERYGLDPDEFLSEPPTPKVLSLSLSHPRLCLVAEKTDIKEIENINIALVSENERLVITEPCDCSGFS
jgi:hypothetical protein